jgi:inorganic phosphate transporter, PiT family
MTAVAIVAAIALALTIGQSAAGNASANLVAARAGTARTILGWSFATHFIGAVLTGAAVVAAVLSAIDVPTDELVTVTAAGTVSAVLFLTIAARLGIPVSAGLVLVGGLAGAAWASSGSEAVVWGGLRGIRPYGVWGAALAVVVAPIAGFAAAAIGRLIAGRLLRRATRRASGPIRASLWLSSGLVGVADGSNDGQKAMAVVVAVLVARGSTTANDIPLWVRVTIGFVLALGTVLGARVLRTVSRGLYGTKGIDAATAEASSAVVIILSSVVGAPVSTTAVVTAGVVGTGLVRRPHHVHWEVVGRIALGYALSLPASMGVGAALYAVFDQIERGVGG